MAKSEKAENISQRLTLENKAMVGFTKNLGVCQELTQEKGD